MITKAVMYFFPPSEQPVTVSSAGSKKNQANMEIPGQAAEALGSAQGALTEEQEQLGKLEEKVRSAASKIEDPIGTAKPEQAKTEVDSGFAVTFQFNPAALRISAYGGGMAPIMVYRSMEGDAGEKAEENSGGQMDYGPLNETVTVSFRVIFDAVKNVQTSYTVRPVVEGFLAAVRNGSSRRVVFLWGAMLYGGYLNNVQCRYTMFDQKGEAVRAEVDLSLVSSAHEDYDEVKRWRQRYDAYMSQKNSIFTRQNGGPGSVTDEITGQVEKAYILFHTQSENQELIELRKQREQAKKEMEQAGYFPVRVWYNPSSITMHSRGGEMVTRSGGFGGTSQPGQFQKNAMPAETVLSMELMFDGFVAPISELFVAAVVSDYSRLVCMVWNRMAFWGELCEAEVEYMMFDKKGNPLRSKVSIRIRQDGKSAENGAYEKNWHRAYKNLEKEAEKLLRI